MSDIIYELVSANEFEGIREANYDTARAVWPTFMLHDEMGNYFTDLFTVPELMKYQFAFIEDKTEKIILLGNSIPLRYEGDIASLPEKGWDWGVEKGVKDFRAGIEPNMVMAIQIMIPPDCRSKGLSTLGLQAMKSIAVNNGFHDLIAPVRPNLKCKYPLTPFDKYVYWTNGNDLPFDPWMRVHSRLGAKIIRPADKSMLIQGTIAEWEEWAKMTFPESGKYFVEGALNSITIDIENDKGTYIEPNVWMHHRM